MAVAAVPMATALKPQSIFKPPGNNSCLKVVQMSIIIAVSALQLTPQDGAIALCAGRQDQIPFSFSLTGQLLSEIKALSKYGIIFIYYHSETFDLWESRGFGGFLCEPTHTFMEQGNLSVRLFDKVF